ncbi:MAG: PD-(D/E)XK nuclease family protein, partial [Spirochaetota bacterium]|nr:PD-(D/E)XK nuclease family protein [Spirochaetota bacterium]
SPENLINKHNISNTLDLEKLNNIYQLYSSVKEANTHNILNILFEVLKITDFINRALVQNNQNSLCQVAYLTELAKSFENCGGETLNSFVESLLIFKDKRTLEEIPDEDILDGVNISTIHNVKGLQYNTVFICDFDPSNQWDGNFHVPNSLLKFKKSPTEDHDNQLRLFYVALTRAKDNLFLTYSKTNQYGYAVKSKSFLEKAIMDSKITMFDQKEINLLIDKKSNSTQDNWIPSNSISLSFSGINSYLTCPLKYQLEYIYKFNTPSNKNAIFGSIIHKALEKIHSALFHNQIIDEEYIIDILAAHANIYKFNNTDELEDTKNRAISILKNYFHSHLPKASCIYLVEEDFEVFWDYEGKYRLIGSFDLVTKSESGAIEIVDFKTGIIDESTENQLLTYALAYELENSLKVSSIKTHYLIDNNIINYTITPEKLDQTKSMINNVFNKVNHKDFYATPSDKNCCHCTFNRCCSFSCYD